VFTARYGLGCYERADKSLAVPGRRQANVSVRIARNSFGALSCRKKSWWQLASRCCWDCASTWYTSVLVSFLFGLRSYQHPGYIVASGNCCYSNAANTARDREREWERRFEQCLATEYWHIFTELIHERCLSYTIMRIYLRGKVRVSTAAQPACS